MGVGFRDAVWADHPSLAMLDAVTQGVPAALISHDLHCVWVNSAAAKRYGVDVDASGLLREDPAFALTRELGRLPDAVVDAWVREAAQKAAARGVVGIVDFEMTWNREVWLRRISGGFGSLRVDAGVYPEHLDRARIEGMRTGQDIPGGNGLLRVGPLKVLIDGSLNTRTAYCVDPYPHGGRGLLTVSEAELRALLVRATESGFVPAVHAIGDAANKVALNAFEAAGIRGRIEHAQFVRQEDFARFGRLGLTASVQPAHALDDRDAADANWGDRTDRAFPLRALLAAGATLALGSDAPVAPLDPWTAMSAATTRSALDGRGPWHPEQAITRDGSPVCVFPGTGPDPRGRSGGHRGAGCRPARRPGQDVRVDAGGGDARCAGGSRTTAARWLRRAADRRERTYGPSASPVLALYPGLDQVGERQAAEFLAEVRVILGFRRDSARRPEAPSRR